MLTLRQEAKYEKQMQLEKIDKDGRNMLLLKFQ